MNEIKEWFESEAPEILLKPNIDERKTSLYGIGDRVYKRMNDWINLEQSINTFQTALNGHISRLTEESKKPQSNLNKEDFEELNKIVQEFNDVLNNSVSKISKAIKFIDPPVSFDAMNRHVKDLNERINKVFTGAEKRVKDEAKRLEKEKKEREEKEKKEKEAANKKEEKKESTTGGAEMQVD